MENALQAGRMFTKLSAAKKNQKTRKVKNPDTLGILHAW
jgi:hypothetical protein